VHRFQELLFVRQHNIQHQVGFLNGLLRISKFVFLGGDEVLGAVEA
jgi:hypothetical protein